MTSLERSHDHHGTNTGGQTIALALESYPCATWKLSSHHVLWRLFENSLQNHNHMTAGDLFPVLVLPYGSRYIFFSFNLFLLELPNKNHEYIWPSVSICNVNCSFLLCWVLHLSVRRQLNNNNNKINENEHYKRVLLLRLKSISVM